MDGLAPFEPTAALAVAVSGGADSMALAVLARDWVRRREGTMHALVVDHGLRMASEDEALITIDRLRHLGISATLLRLTNLKHGPALAERARISRYKALSDACRGMGILHLLLGHHAADQVETVMMRTLRGSRMHGLAGMSALVETNDLRLLRPLLGIEPMLLRRFLTATGIAWIEDPSNQDMRALRVRLRHGLSADTRNDIGLREACLAVARVRLREEVEIASELAHRAVIRPEGFALLSPGQIGSAALRHLIQTVGGARYPSHAALINDLAAEPRPATVAGIRIVPAGRFGDGLLIVREEEAVMEPVEARPGVIWDNRFRVVGKKEFPNGATIGKLGADAAQFRSVSTLPSVVLRTLPAVRVGRFLAATPHMGHATEGYDASMTVMFTPPQPMAGACFKPTR